MNTLKRLLPIAFCLLCLPSAHADLIKQSAAYNRTVLMTSTTDHITGATGLTAFTVTLSKAGGTVATITPTITEIGAGRYSVALVTGNTGALGALDMTITATGADPTDSHDQVVAFDPNSDLGAATLVTVNTTTTNTNAAVAALPAANATAVWGAATKSVTGGTITTVTNAVVLPTTPPAGYGGGSTGDTPGTTTLLAKIGTPAGASLAADIAAAKSDTGSLVTSVAALPAAVWTYTASDGLTHQQSDALRTAILTRGFSVSYSVSTRTQVTTYFKADGVTALAVTTVVYDTTGRAATRTTAFTNLP